MNTPARNAASSGRRSRRSAARLAAVQALYQIDLTSSDSKTVIDEFRSHRLDAAGDQPDAAYFGEIVAGVDARRTEIDSMLAALLAEGWTIARLETVLRAVLRAGAFELIARGDVPARVVIDEYVQVAHAFFAGKEPAVVNGVLDRLARRVRPDEFEGQPRAAEDAPGR
ncbi:MAG TPA: transcription antitermination factor NusB [Alphaproteobacteria bacterium]